MTWCSWYGVCGSRLRAQELIANRLARVASLKVSHMRSQFRHSRRVCFSTAFPSLPFPPLQWDTLVGSCANELAAPPLPRSLVPLTLCASLSGIDFLLWRRAPSNTRAVVCRGRFHNGSMFCLAEASQPPALAAPLQLAATAAAAAERSLAEGQLAEGQLAGAEEPRAEASEDRVVECRSWAEVCRLFRPLLKSVAGNLIVLTQFGDNDVFDLIEDVAQLMVQRGKTGMEMAVSQVGFRGFRVLGGWVLGGLGFRVRCRVLGV